MVIIGRVPFRFIDHGPLVDRELELVAPADRWLEDMLKTLSHPRSVAEPSVHGTREELLYFVNSFPNGHAPVGYALNGVPTYHFWMRLNPQFSPPVPMAGNISLRVGWTPDLVNYIGHIGYGVYPPARGQRYAARACQLLIPLARQHQLPCLWITCNPENIPSRKTCEMIGGRMIDIVDLPRTHFLYQQGERQKCRYRVDL